MTRRIEPWKQQTISDGNGSIAERFNRWLELIRSTLNLLVDAVFNGKFPLIIVEADAAYAITNEDTVNCDGTFSVTLPNGVDAIKEHTVTATNGNITLTNGDGKTIQAPTTVTTGSSATVYFARDQWWHK